MRKIIYFILLILILFQASCSFISEKHFHVLQNILSENITKAIIPASFLNKASKQQEYTCNFFAMDTYMQITVYGPEARSLSALAQKEILRLDALLACQQPESEVTALNRSRSMILSADTAFVIKKALQVHQETNGSFNITLAPLSSLWGFPNGPYRIPSPEERKEALKKTGAEFIFLDPKTRSCELRKPGLSIDLGGIGKGYASEQAIKLLKAGGVTSALLNLGGNIQTIGKKPDGSPWNIAVRHPDIVKSYLGILAIDNAAVVTSGDYERFFVQNGKRYHHILDPKTGSPTQNGLRSITVVCPDGVLADALSTALFVMGLHKAISYWQTHKNEFQLLLYGTDGSLYITENLAASFSNTENLPLHILK